ncbi:hypothetical protein Tco_1127726, partial [Tanacetum coccineum]
MEEDLAVLFGDDDFEDDASDGFDEEEVWEVIEEWLMAPTTPPPMLAVPPLSVYEVGGPSTAAVEGSSFTHSAPRLPIPLVVIEDLSTRLGNLEYGHGQLVQRVNLVSDTEVAASVTIGELGPWVYAVEGQKDRPPMLGPGRYAQWQSRFLCFLRKCILEGPYKPTRVVIEAVEATENSPAVPQH